VDILGGCGSDLTSDRIQMWTAKPTAVDLRGLSTAQPAHDRPCIKQPGCQPLCSGPVIRIKPAKTRVWSLLMHAVQRINTLMTESYFDITV
jgi:hypothetical protein